MAKLKAKVILEMLGSPKEHVEGVLNQVVEGMKKQENLTVVKAETFPAEKKEDEDLFASFSEVEAEFNKPVDLYEFCFTHLPSSVDVLEPEEISFNALDFSNALNDLLATLHKQDLALKNTAAKHKILNKNVNRLIANFIVHICKKPSSSKEISEHVGLPEEEVQKIIKILEKEKKIKKEGEKYKHG